MKTRPILFSTEMVRAIQEGRKTQTRRIVKHQTKEEQSVGIATDKHGNEYWVIGNPNESTVDIISCPYGKPGDVLWVRETFCKFPDGEILYKANGCKPVEPYKWKPSIHMPKDAARIWLKITHLRVERLQSISQDDAMKEGIEWEPSHTFDSLLCRDYRLSNLEGLVPISAAQSFQSLWTSINGGDSWEANPWVWVVEFERIEKPDNA